MGKYGWIPDLPDRRDEDFALKLVSLRVVAALPPRVDMRAWGPAIYDQGQLGSCTANAIGAALQFDQLKQREKSFQPSRLFIYYNERVMEGTVNADAGAMIRDGIKSVNAIGACPEYLWPYDIAKFADKPLARAFQNAWYDKALLYQRVIQTADQMRATLAAKLPIVIGFTVYESFESQAVADSGVVPMPRANESVLGGHAVMIVGYDDATQRFIVRNSWGTGWGQAGYFTVPYAYFTNPNLADDLWAIQQVR